MGAAIRKEKECGVVESVKAASDLYSPVTGVVSEINSRLETEPELVNQDPYGEGWIFKAKGFNAAELNSLLDSKAYEKLLESRK
jgi:glycine cleavage system H protein